MSRLEKFLAKPKEIDLDGEKILIKPLTLKDMPLILKLGKDETTAEAVTELVQRTLKDCFPDATQQELDSVSIEYFQKIIDAIMDVNNLKSGLSAEDVIKRFAKK